MYNYSLVDTPKDIVNAVLMNHDARLIKVKCVGCSGTDWIPYVKPVIKDRTLTIGESNFPLYLVEEISIRGDDDIGRYTQTFKASAKYLKTLLSEKTIRELELFGMGQ